MDLTYRKNKNMKPLRNKVLIRPFPPDEKSAGGIIVSEAHRAVSNKCEVIATGRGTEKLPMEFKPGDVVFRIQNCGEEYIIDGQKHFMVESNWILAKLN